MKLSNAISEKIEWSFTNVSHRTGAVPEIGIVDIVDHYVAGVIHALCEQTMVIEREIDWYEHDLEWA